MADYESDLARLEAQFLGLESSLSGLEGVAASFRREMDGVGGTMKDAGREASSMSRSMFSEVQNAGAGFGLGFAVTQDVARSMIPGSVGEYYWGGLFSTSFFIDPVEKLHLIFMTQLSPSSTFPIRRELKTMLYAALN